MDSLDCRVNPSTVKHVPRRPVSNFFGTTPQLEAKRAVSKREGCVGEGERSPVPVRGYSYSAGIPGVCGFRFVLRAAGELPVCSHWRLRKMLEVRMRMVVRVRNTALTEIGVMLIPLLEPHLLLPQCFQSYTPMHTICKIFGRRFSFHASGVSS